MALFIHDDAVLDELAYNEAWADLHEDMFEAMYHAYPGTDDIYNDVTALMLMGGCSGEYYV